MHISLEEPAARRNAVQASGDGPPLVLVHGFGCDQTMWDAFLEHESGHSVVRYDLTGMGASVYDAYDPARHSSLEGHAEDLVEILEQCVKEPAVLVGHSVSAMIAGLVAIKRPELVKGIVMLCPNPYYLKDGDYDGGFNEEDLRGLMQTIDENYQGWSGTLAHLVSGEDNDKVEAQLEERFCRNDPWITRHFAEVTFLSDLRTELAGIQVPTLVVDMENDIIASKQVGDYVTSHLPNSERTTLPGRGHAPHMTMPKQTLDAVIAFEKKLKA